MLTGTSQGVPKLCPEILKALSKGPDKGSPNYGPKYHRPNKGSLALKALFGFGIMS